MKNKLSHILICAAAAFCACGCSNSVDTDKPVITVSIEPQRWLLERIVGDKIKVKTLLANGADPESYEPTFSQLATLEKSSSYFCIGNLGFEAAITEKIKENNPRLNIVVVSDSIDFIVSHDHDDCNHHGHEHEHEHGIDPHVWNSAVNARIIAKNMLGQVIKLDPQNAGEYERNYRTLIAHIDSIDALCRSILAPVQGASFAVWHPSLSYFARDYNLHQMPLGSEGKEPSVGEMRRLIDQLGNANVSVFLSQQNFDTSRVEVLAADLSSLRVKTINPLNYEWDNELVHTAHAIANR